MMRWKYILPLVLVALLLAGCAGTQEQVKPIEKSTEQTSGEQSGETSKCEFPPNIHANPITEWNKKHTMPDIDPTAFVHPYATVIGDVHIGKYVCVSPHASIRGDEGMPIYIGDYSNVQDGVVIHALETYDKEGKPIEKNLIEVNGKKYAVYIGNNVSLAHQCQIHGPAYIGDHTFVGMQALVFRAKIGSNCVIEPGAKIIGRNGIITIPDGKYVPAGSVITTQEQADNLPNITEDYPFKTTNKAVVHVNVELAHGYNEMFKSE